jgi:hypothetical protein
MCLTKKNIILGYRRIFSYTWLCLLPQQRKQLLIFYRQLQAMKYQGIMIWKLAMLPTIQTFQTPVKTIFELQAQTVKQWRKGGGTDR